MIKKIKEDKPKKPMPMWKKIVYSILVLVLVFISGSFYPNPYTLHKTKKSVEAYYTEWANKLGLQEPSMEYENDVQFVKALNVCIDYINFQTPRMERVPREMIMGQAALESAWGTSRFAIEGNNLFGIRTWGDHPGMLPKGFPKTNPWQVRVFPSKCASVKEYVRILNNHPAYEEFRKMRTKQLVLNNKMDGIELIKTLTKFSTTPDYADRVIRIIERVRKLENTVATDKTVNKPVKKVPPKEKVSDTVIPKEKPKEVK